jgi:hypothetical protein
VVGPIHKLIVIAIYFYVLLFFRVFLLHCLKPIELLAIVVWFLCGSCAHG